VTTRSLFHRRDPDWEVDGPAARREQRSRRMRSGLAFATAVTAVAGAALAWSIQLGLAAALGIHASLPFG
jgi:hypothetical protein